jgi:hypothetical protein
MRYRAVTAVNATRTVDLEVASAKNGISKAEACTAILDLLFNVEPLP